jgi:hypothetical protein
MRRGRNHAGESELLECASTSASDCRDAQLRGPGAPAAPQLHQIHRLGHRARADEDREIEIFETIDQREDRAEIVEVLDLDCRKPEYNAAGLLDSLR